jgi:hypothetical protein
VKKSSSNNHSRWWWAMTGNMILFCRNFEIFKFKYKNSFKTIMMNGDVMSSRAAYLRSLSLIVNDIFSCGFFSLWFFFYFKNHTHISKSVSATKCAIFLLLLLLMRIMQISIHKNNFFHTEPTLNTRWNSKSYSFKFSLLFHVVIFVCSKTLLILLVVFLLFVLKKKKQYINRKGECQRV